MARKVDEEKRQAVLDAAARMFLDRGYEGVSIDDVADAAGVARRTVYNRFKSKEVLFDGVAEAVWSDLRSSVETIPFNEQANSVEAVATVARVVAEFWLRPQAMDFLRLAISEGPRFPKLAESYFNSGKLPIFRALVNHIELLSARGTLSKAAGEDAELVTKQLIGLINEPLLWPRLLGAPEPPKRERERIIIAAAEVISAHYG